MKKIEILNLNLTEFQKNKLIQIAQNSNINYFQTWPNLESDYTYFLDSILIFKKQNFLRFIKDISILNNVIIKKFIYYILKYDLKKLFFFGLNFDVIDVLDFEFNKKLWAQEFLIKWSFFWRYDFVIDNKFWFKLVELNSLVPAWLPESLFSLNFDIIIKKNSRDYFEKIENLNKYFFLNMKNSFSQLFTKLSKSKWKNLIILYTDDQFWEDYSNSIYMKNFFYNNLRNYKININISDIENIEIRDDWIYFENIKQNYIWSFYPIERYFCDRWNKYFWNNFKNNNFDILNWVINLVTQSKSFWAYIFENINNNKIWLSEFEKRIIKKYIPNYYFDKSKIKTISKPVLYREWVWIWDENFCWMKVFQKMVNQKKIEIQDKNILKNWFLTLWLYFWTNWYIWTFSRYCENFISDYNSYFIPSYISKK